MPKQKVEPCTKEEIDKIIDLSADNDYYQTLFLLAKSTGRRLGEYMKMQVKDVDFENGTIRTIVLKRRMPIYKDALLTPESSRLLKSYILRHNLKLEDFVFGARKRISVQFAIRRYGLKAGITHRVCFHNFRHYFVTFFLQKGWSYDQIAKLTGHSSPQTLVHYDHAVLADVRKRAETDLVGI